MAIQSAADNQSDSNPNKPHHNHHQNMSDDDHSTASETINNLKSLNALLLKETKQKREQVDSLVQSNKDLESDINRSAMENDSLKSEINALTEKSTMLEIETRLMVVFMKVQVNDVIGGLESDMKRILNEKSEIERVMKEKELEIGDLNRRLDEVLVEIDEERGVSASVGNERDEIRARLDAKTREVSELAVKVRNVEENEARVLKEVDELLIMCQVESEAGVRTISEIASVDGVDCVQMGPSDLCASMGYLLDPWNKKVKEMLRTAEKGVLKTTGTGKSGGAFLSGFATTYDRPEDMRLRGYHMIIGALDIGVFRTACLDDVKKFKMESKINGA